MPTALSPPTAALLLAEARARTLLLIATVSEEDLRRQHDPLMGPIIWDLGHIAHFEELWLLNNLGGRIDFGEMPGLFNPFEHPRAERGSLALPALCELVELLEAIRSRVLERLEEVDFDDSSPLLRDGYVYRMVAQHEYQHNETILQTLQLKKGSHYAAPRSALVPSAQLVFEPGSMVYFAGGSVEIGTDDRRAAYDNERPRHRVELRPFWIDVTPVTNADYLAFMEQGGYRRREWWSDAGWAWLQESGVEAPRYWMLNDGSWKIRTMDRIADAESREPVCHVCYYEADAYARFARKRLPSEAEWEAASSWDPVTGTKCDYPWGDQEPSPLHANIDQLAFRTAPVGAFPLNISPTGCYGMIGDVWEWTSSNFGGYPGYESFPYPEYSEVFFGTDYKVLRGGSWATRPGALRNTFRNWDYPIRRQIFSGFRCARDA